MGKVKDQIIKEFAGECSNCYRFVYFLKPVAGGDRLCTACLEEFRREYDDWEKDKEDANERT